MPKKNPDVKVTGLGSLFLVWPLTKVARDWVQDRVQLDGYQWFGRANFAVEHGYIENVIAGMREAGMKVESEVQS